MRKRYFVGSRLQSKYLNLLLISMTLPTVLVGIYLYFLNFNIIKMVLTPTEYVAQGIFPNIDKVSLILIIGLPVILLLLFIWGLLFSHRFAGPIERLMKELNDIAEKSDFSHRLRVRTSDDLKPFVDSINKVLERAEQKTAN